MKKRLLLLLVALATTALLLTSCLVVNGPGNQGGENDGGDDEFPYGAIVKGADFEEDLSELQSIIKDNFGVNLFVVGDSGTTLGGSIVVGKTNRSISATALSSLESAMSKFVPSESADKACGYVIYAEGEDVAIYWSDELVRELALSEFESLLLEDVSFEGGFKKEEVISSLEYKRAKEAKATEEMYAAIEAELGHDTVVALQQLYGIYDDRLYKWMAELYDPGVQNPDGSYAGGGFYYSNSARATQGFLPDLESTVQLLGFFSGTGMLYEYNNKASEAFPAWMKEQMIAFARSCQSSVDGYFYHPQWGSFVSETRKGRDLMWGANLLSTLGAKPYWDTPRGDKGLYGAPGSEMTASLGSRSSVSAVSYVVAAEATSHLPAYLQSEEAFKEKLDSYNWPSTTNINDRSGTSYSGVGGEIDAIADQVIAAGYGEYLIAYLDDFQEKIQQLRRANGLEPNGLWDAVTCYDGVNGLMKICAVYERMKMGINYAEEAFASVVEIIVLEGEDVDDVEPNAVITVYNPWITLNRLIDSIEAAGDLEKGAELRQLVRDDAVRMINVSRDKIVKFKQDDGSYGMRYATEAVNSSLYGTTVAVPGTIEGEVNGAILATNSLTREISEALGIEKIIGREKVPMFNDSDFDVMMDIIEDLTPVQKAEITFENQAVDFESEEADADGTAAMGLTGTRFNDSTVTIKEDVTDPDNLVLNVNKKGEGSNGDKFGIAVYPISGKNCFVFDFDIYVRSFGKNNNLQVRIDNCYNLLLRGSDNGFVVGSMTSHGSDGATNLFGYEFGFDQWHNIRVEYYPSGDYAGTAKVYVNGALISVNKNYIGSHVNTVPPTSFTTVLFFMDSKTAVDADFDNLFGDHGDANVTDMPDTDTANGFDSDSGYIAGNASTTVTIAPDSSSNKALKIAADDTVKIYSGIGSLSYNVASATARFYVDSASTTGEVATLWLGGATLDDALIAYMLKLDGNNLRLVEYTKNGEGDVVIDGLPTDEWFELTVEHYIYQFDKDYSYCRGIVYLDGDESAYTDVFYSEATLSKAFAVFGIATKQQLYVDDVAAVNIEKTYVDESGDEIADPGISFPTIAPDQNAPSTNLYTGIQNFNDMSLGINIPEGFYTMLNNEPGNTLEIVEDPENDENKMMMLRTEPADSGGNTIGVEYKAGGDNYIFEASFNFAQITEMGAGFLQLSVRPDKSSNYGIFAVCFKKVGNTVSLCEFNGSSAGTEIYSGIELDEWVTLRIEMPLDEDKAVVTVTYGEDVVEYTSTSFWTDKVAEGVDVKTLTPQYFRIFSPRAMDNLIYIDDITAISE